MFLWFSCVCFGSSSFRPSFLLLLATHDPLSSSSFPPLPIRFSPGHFLFLSCATPQRCHPSSSSFAQLQSHKHSACMRWEDSPPAKDQRDPTAGQRNQPGCRHHPPGPPARLCFAKGRWHVCEGERTHQPIKPCTASVRGLCHSAVSARPSSRGASRSWKVSKHRPTKGVGRVGDKGEGEGRSRNHSRDGFRRAWSPSSSGQE